MKANRGLLVIGFIISLFFILKHNTVFAGPQMKCKASKTNVCYVNIWGRDVLGIFYVEIK